MVEFSGIRSFFTGGASSAAAPAPAAPSAPAPSAPAAKPTGDSFTTGASDPARTLSKFSGDARSYTDPATAAGTWLGEKLKPHLSESTRQKAEELGKAVEDFKKREDLPGHDLAQKGWQKIDEASKGLDGFMKEHIPGLKRALEPKPVDGGEID